MLLATPNLPAFAQGTPDKSTELSVPHSVGTTDWDKIINTDTNERITFGVKIMGPTPYDRNADTLFIPASNTKLFTTAAALEKLGADFRYETKVQWQLVHENDRGSITELKIIGSGDPTWGMMEFGESLTTRIDFIADRLVAEGVKSIHGPIEFAANDARWNRLRFPEGWIDEDKTACYGALAQAFNLQINCALFTVTAPTKGAWQEPGVPIRVELKIAAGTRTALEVETLEAGDSVRGAGFRITGTWAKAKPSPVASLDFGFKTVLEPSAITTFSAPSVTFALPIAKVTDWARNLLIASLEKRGVKFTGASDTLARRTKKAANPVLTGAAQSFSFFSPRLAEILKPFNKSSINHTGAVLFNTLGQRFGPRNTKDLLEAGQSVIRDYVTTVGVTAARALKLEPQPGYFSEKVTLYDGAGISRANIVTTGAVMALLMDLQRRTDFPIVWDSLPIAGVDGTLAGRMKGTAAEGVLRAKTGSLRGIYNLSGYFPRLNADGSVADFVPFVVLTRTELDDKQGSRGTQDKLGAALAALINPQLERPNSPIVPAAYFEEARETSTPAEPSSQLYFSKFSDKEWPQ